MRDRAHNTRNTSLAWRIVQVVLACAVVLAVHFTASAFLLGPGGCSSEREAEIEVIQITNMVETYRLASTPRLLPTSLEQLEVGENRLTEEVPKDPWGNDYLYVYARVDQQNFVVFSAGPDGLAGTEDDVFDGGFR